MNSTIKEKLLTGAAIVIAVPMMTLCISDARQEWLDSHPAHSSRSVLAGSTRDARRAGTQVASPATTVSNIAAATNVTGSLGATP